MSAAGFDGDAPMRGRLAAVVARLALLLCILVGFDAGRTETSADYQAIALPDEASFAAVVVGSDPFDDDGAAPDISFAQFANPGIAVRTATASRPQVAPQPRAGVFARRYRARAPPIA
jgi:hypothetical protein